MPTAKEILVSEAFILQLESLVGKVTLGEIREEKDDGITRLKIPVSARELLGTYTIVIENGLTRAFMYQGKHPLSPINVHLYTKLEDNSYVRVDSWDKIHF